MRFHPNHFAFPGELNGTNDMMLRHSQCKNHIAVLGNRSVSLQQNSAEADIVADGLKLRNCVGERKLHLDRIAYGETTVLAFRLIRWPANVVGFSHSLCCFRWGDLYVDTFLNAPTTVRRGSVREDNGLELNLGYLLEVSEK
jgi:hypothetical protein